MFKIPTEKFIEMFFQQFEARCRETLGHKVVTCESRVQILYVREDFFVVAVD